jgi:hypothetical protein
MLPNMKSFFLFLIFIISIFSLKAQGVKDSGEKTIQMQLISNNDAYYLVQEREIKSQDENSKPQTSFNFKLKRTIDNGKTFSYCNIDTIKQTLNEGVNHRNIHIRFVDNSLGFIYGCSGNEKNKPFLFRTEDGGVTWSIIFANEISTPLRRNDFYMFSNLKGILITNWNSQPYFNYSITEDGGKTWSKKSFKISQIDFQISNNDELLSAVYTDQAEVTIRLSKPDSGNPSSSEFIIIQSIDYGQTFKELR